MGGEPRLHHIFFNGKNQMVRRNAGSNLNFLCRCANIYVIIIFKVFGDVAIGRYLFFTNVSGVM